DNLPVTEKDTIVSEETLVLYSKNAYQSLEEYMDFVSQRMNAIKWKNVPAGWCSWYFYYTMPDEGEIIENTDFLANRFGKEIEWIQIDDGYQMKVGDWDENSRFGSGLAALVKKIKEKGYRAGVWTAPFVASEHSEIFKDKRDWFVRDHDNNPIVVGENPLWLGNYHALDLTNPKVLKHIKGIFTKLKQDGFEYFKIDFLYHAALLGQRHDSKITRAQAIRRGLEVIREAVGDDMILGCGAPLGPCIGMVNMMRIGTDIATHWRYDWGGGVYECSVNTMTRAVMHDRLWVNDPDCVLVRQDDNELTEEEVKLWLNVVALSGGAILLSDRMMEVSEERLAFIDKVLPPYRKTARAIDAFEKENPSIFALTLENPSGKWVVLGLINLNETPIDISVLLETIGLDPSVPHHVFDFWNQEYHGLSEEQIAIFGLKPHTSKLLVIRPESEIPSILSTSIHFTQGAVELSDVDWNDGGKELSMKIKKNSRQEESIFFVFSDQWIPSRAYVDDEKIGFEEIAPEVVAVKHKFKKGQILRVVFKQ
ncbi:MAG: alpha-galactosidase, partial [Candidatus Thorarchaeota archaeon]